MVAGNARPEGRAGLGRTLAIAALVVVAVWVGSNLFRGRTLPAGAAAPAFEVQLADGSGRTVSLADLSGQVVVLDFWATTCPPCLRQMEGLETLHRRLKERGVAVLGVSVGGEGADDIAAFAKRRNVGYPMAVDDGAAAQAYRVAALPTLYVIGRDGRIVNGEVGYAPPEAIEEQVGKALGKK
ncbi:MAG: TlpA disulfide reductase family protein [Deltaproteobacteria bacterium]|nr:TlpA disulfide reductase family protein [Deltaproteobacteria bacterium]